MLVDGGLREPLLLDLRGHEVLDVQRLELGQLDAAKRRLQVLLAGDLVVVLRALSATTAGVRSPLVEELRHRRRRGLDVGAREDFASQIRLDALGVSLAGARDALAAPHAAFVRAELDRHEPRLAALPDAHLSLPFRSAAQCDERPRRKACQAHARWASATVRQQSAGAGREREEKTPAKTGGRTWIRTTDLFLIREAL